MRDGEPQIYTSLATMRNGYMVTQWQRVQMFLVFNTVAIPLVLGSTANEEIKLFVSVAGMLVHWVVLHGTLRADNWIKYLDARMIELEGLDITNDASVRVQVFSHPDFTARRHSWLASRRFFGLVGLSAFVFWIWQFVLSVQLA